MLVIVVRCGNHLFKAATEQRPGYARVWLDRFQFRCRVCRKPTHFDAVAKKSLDLLEPPACRRLADAVIGILCLRRPRALPVIERVRCDLGEPDQMVRAGPGTDMLRGGLVFAMGMFIAGVAVCLH